MTHPILEGLNPEQAKAVQHTDGPLLLLAGAGSGKTRVLVHRIAWLIREHGVSPEEILAVTFTNKAAREMRERTEAFVGYDGRGVWLSTFHSACTAILRAHGEKIDLNPQFTIFDALDQKNLMKSVLQDMDINTDKHKPVAVLSQVDRAKQDYKSPDAFSDSESFTGLPFSRVYRAYQNGLRAQDALDFSDLLYECVRLFESSPELLAQYHQSIRYIMIDEYQDTNYLQYKWTSMLAAGHKNLCVVGDDDQSIYSWRGADIRNILDFQKEFPEANVIKLEQNYRSTQTILDAAHAVIEKNTQRTEKKLWTAQKGGKNLRLQGVATEKEEARVALDWLMRDTTTQDLRQRAIFYRTNAQSRILEEECIKRRIPYRVYGGVGFYSRKEVKDVLAYLRVLINPKDLISWSRIINTPKRGIGRVSQDKIMGLAEGFDGDGFKAISAACQGTVLAAGARNKLISFAQQMQHLRSLILDKSVSEVAYAVLHDTGYMQELKLEGTEEAKARIENLDELLLAMEQFEESNEDPSLTAYLQSVSLLSDVDADEGDDTLSLMTLHMAKGLEFDRVAMVGLEEEILPSARSVAESPVQGLQEERRLCYVGITRARKELALFYAQARRVYGQIRPGILTRFVKDIPENLIDNHTVAAASAQQLGFGGPGGFGGRQTYGRPAQPRRNTDPNKTRGVSKSSLAAKASRHRGVGSGANSASAAQTALPKNGVQELAGWSLRDKVKHPSLGIGIIRGLEESSVGAKLTIDFPSGRKVILPKYVALERI
jgi:DNA helicase-2/ATP-dependent DNA helicase PcrA